MPALQFEFNNASNASTELTSNQLKFDFFSRGLTSLLDSNKPENEAADLNLTRIIYRKKAADVIFYANAQMKLRYDSKHKPLKLNAGGYVYLQLHHEYQLPNKPNKKFGNQYAGPFLVKRKIGQLTYELELSATSRVHSIISITQLKPIDASEDSYQRPKPNYSEPIDTENDDNSQHQNPRYEVERMIDRRQQIFERTKV